MSYQVLARKWRPRNFATLVGQEHVVRALSHALEQKRLHHAWLFTGTRGVGKTTLSRILAKALNCVGPDGTGDITAEPCGVCQACTEIDAGRFVDYIEMDAASNRGIGEMTTLLEQAIYAPSNARFKVYMIDEVHMLTNQAFNAMLKTLEEPPPHIKFILATTDPQKIPVTVLSRCLQFNLKQMPPAQIVGHLDHILRAEGVPFEPPALRLLAQSASGSMRDALSLTDQAIAYSAGTVTEDTVRAMLGSLDQTYLVRILDALAAADGPGLLAVADEIAARSLSYNTALQDLGVLLHHVALAQVVPSAIGDDWPEADHVRRLAQVFSPEEVQLHYQIAAHGRSELGLAPDEYAGFSMTLLRMLAFRPTDGGSGSVQPAPPTRQAAPLLRTATEAGRVTASVTLDAVPERATSTVVPVAAAQPAVTAGTPVGAAPADAAVSGADAAPAVARVVVPAVVPAVADPQGSSPPGSSTLVAGVAETAAPPDSAPPDFAHVDTPAPAGSPASSNVTAATVVSVAAAPPRAVVLPWEDAPAVPAGPTTAPGLPAAATPATAADQAVAGPASVTPIAPAWLDDAKPEPTTVEPAAASDHRPAAVAAESHRTSAPVPVSGAPAPRARVSPAAAALAAARSASGGRGARPAASATTSAAGVADAAAHGVAAGTSGSAVMPAAVVAAAPAVRPMPPAAADDDEFAPPAWFDEVPPEDDMRPAGMQVPQVRPATAPPAEPPSARSVAAAASMSPAEGDTPGAPARSFASSTMTSTSAPAADLAAALAEPMVLGQHGPLPFDGNWIALASALKVSGMARQLVQQAELIGHDGEGLRLRVPMRALLEGGTADKVRQALAQHFGRPLALAIEVGAVQGTTVAAMEIGERQARQAEAEEAISADPFVQSLLRDFGAQVVPGSVRPLQ